MQFKGNSAPRNLLHLVLFLRSRYSMQNQTRNKLHTQSAHTLRFVSDSLCYFETSEIAWDLHASQTVSRLGDNMCGTLSSFL